MGARDYQIYAAQSVWDYFEKHSGNPLILMPTGTGKSHVISEFAHSILYYYPRTRVVCLTHVKELINQNYSKFVQAWPNAPAGVYSAGLGRRDIHNNIVFAGIQSVAKKAHAFGHVDLVLIDEAHTVNPEKDTNYMTFLSGLKAINPHLKIIGLTATGWRLGYGKIWEGENRLFTDVCVDMTTIESFNWFIAQGYLLPLVPKRTQLKLDITGVHMQGGDYIQSELQNAVDKADITTRALREAMELGKDRRKWLIFTSGIEHAQHVSDELTALGVPCGVVHSKMGSKSKERDQVLADHKAGRIRAVANANILTTGYDDPEIDMIIMLRPTMSPVLWVQMLGRGTRPCYMPGFDLATLEGRMASIGASQKQNCLVLDFAGNTRNLGPINDPVVPRKKGEKSGPAPVKICDACETYNHASARVCAHCGAEFTFMTKLKQAASTEELIKGDMPVVESFKISSVTYQQYVKPGKPKMLKVSYYCGLRKFDEYVCLDHEPGYARMKAQKWIKARAPDPSWTNMRVDEVLSAADYLQVPTHLQIWTNKQYPEIMNYDFSGTAFGTQIPAEERPTASVLGPRDVNIVKLADLQDDNIPF
jgi:DNA repair protein RadD